MEFEVLKKSHLKRNIIIGVVAVLLISAIILNFTRAKYRTTADIPIASGTINYSLADLNIVGLYIDGEEATELDSSKKYTLDTSRSTCTYKDGSTIDNLSLNYDSDTKTFTIAPYTTKGTKCYLYFDEKLTAGDTIIANSKKGTGTPNFSKTSCTNGTNNRNNCGEETVGLYEEQTSLGTTYYFRGDVDDNYLVFANKYWRIIRINEDESIRVIYSGEKSEVDAAGKEMVLANGYNDGSTQYTQIGTSAFNSSSNRSEYVGFRYTEESQRPSDTNSGDSSTIKGVLDTWYSNNLQAYDNMIANTPGFCNDRTPQIGNSWVSTGTMFYYAANERRSKGTPTYECSNTNDLYQTKIGLITADEVIYAGGTSSSNYSYYLYTGNFYWTMSPYDFNSGSARMFSMYSPGFLSTFSVDYIYGVRPVINISSNITITGSGTIQDPYTVN